MRKPEVTLFASAAILVLGLGSAVVMQLRSVGAESMLREDAALFRDAVEAYRSAYGRLPTRFNGYFDVSYGDDPQYPNQLIMNILLAKDLPDNRAHRLNPQQTVFMTNETAAAGRSGLRADREWVDPWGMPYRLVLDTDSNGVCNLNATIHHETPAVGFRGVLWSCGPDGVGNTSDDVLTWRLLYD